jgi:3-methyl-2-oxobutanoate hydroxymethyltransferase
VKRGAPNTHIVADLPFLTYHTSDEQALRNAGRLLQEGGADSVKLEGGEAIAPRIRALVDAGIPVMAHVGLGPQSVGTLGGFRLQGRDLESAKRVIADAEAVAQAGAFAVVIEMVPAEVTELITSRIAVPTIGIGAGPACDGQVLIYADIIGLDPSFKLKLARRYAEVGRIIGEAFTAFGDDVRGGRFPSEDETFHLDPEIAADLRDHLASS